MILQSRRQHASLLLCMRVHPHPHPHPHPHTLVPLSQTLVASRATICSGDGLLWTRQFLQFDGSNSWKLEGREDHSLNWSQQVPQDAGWPHPTQLASTVTTLGSGALLGYMEVHQSPPGGLGPTKDSEKTPSLNGTLPPPLDCLQRVQLTPELYSTWCCRRGASGISAC